MAAPEVTALDFVTKANEHSLILEDLVLMGRSTQDTHQPVKPGRSNQDSKLIMRMTVIVLGTILQGISTGQ
jgi:hypothetical protein